MQVCVEFMVLKLECYKEMAAKYILFKLIIISVKKVMEFCYKRQRKNNFQTYIEGCNETLIVCKTTCGSIYFNER